MLDFQESVLKKDKERNLQKLLRFFIMLKTLFIVRLRQVHIFVSIEYMYEYISELFHFVSSPPPASLGTSASSISNL